MGEFNFNEKIYYLDKDLKPINKPDPTEDDIIKMDRILELSMELVDSNLISILNYIDIYYALGFIPGSGV